MTQAETPCPWQRMGLLVTGWALIVLSPVVGVVPGPGGLLVFAAGLVLVLRNSIWAKRQFVRACRRWPRFGVYADKALRRDTPRRRQWEAAHAR